MKKTILILLVLTIATTLNVLYIIDLIPEWSFRIGFLVVMICSIIVNIKNITVSKKPKMPKDTVTLANNDNINKLFKVLLLCVTLIWFSTFIVAEITK